MNTLLVRLQRWVDALMDTLPTEYSRRSCQGAAWKRAFPAASSAEIREFLSMFVRAFAFPDRHRLQFSPDDAMLVIYRRLYPQRWMPDALEFEKLAEHLKRQHGLTLGSRWHDGMTLGELFAWTRGPEEVGA